jgi:hypothetical protein
MGLVPSTASWPGLESPEEEEEEEEAGVLRLVVVPSLTRIRPVERSTSYPVVNLEITYNKQRPSSFSPPSL